MELIRLSENKNKLILNTEEIEIYGICRDRQKNIKAVEKLFLYLKKSSGIELAYSSASIKIKLCDNGECEIMVENFPIELETKTFAFDEKSLECLFDAMKNSDYTKNSALYKYKSVYILEMLSPKNSPLPCRIADFGKEVSLCSRRDFLSSVCTRINFP